MKLSDKQFRAVIESKFKIELSEEVFKSLLKKVPVDDNGMVKYVEFMSNFDSRSVLLVFLKNHLIIVTLVVTASPAF